jgi:hypothetical protein
LRRVRRNGAGGKPPAQSFEQMQKMMKMMGKGGLQKMMRSVKSGFPGLR